MQTQFHKHVNLRVQHWAHKTPRASISNRPLSSHLDLRSLMHVIDKCYSRVHEAFDRLGSIRPTVEQAAHVDPGPSPSRASNTETCLYQEKVGFHQTPNLLKYSLSTTLVCFLVILPVRVSLSLPERMSAVRMQQLVGGAQSPVLGVPNFNNIFAQKFDGAQKGSDGQGSHTKVIPVKPQNFSRPGAEKRVVRLESNPIK